MKAWNCHHSLYLMGIMRQIFKLHGLNHHSLRGRGHPLPQFRLISQNYGPGIVVHVQQVRQH